MNTDLIFAMWFWCAIRSFYSEQRVFEQYSKTSLVSVAEGFLVVFKGAIQLLRVISRIFEKKNPENWTHVILILFFLNAEILVPGGRPGSAKDVLRKKSHHNSVEFSELQCAVWFIPGC